MFEEMGQYLNDEIVQRDLSVVPIEFVPFIVWIDKHVFQ